MWLLQLLKSRGSGSELPQKDSCFSIWHYRNCLQSRSLGCVTQPVSHAPTRNEGVTTFSWVTGIAKSDGAGLELKFGAQTAFVSKAVLMSPTEFVRMAIIDKYGDSGSQNALKAFHCLSEDQCRALVKDQDKLNAWLASKFLLYKEEGETKIQQYVSCDPASTRRAQPLRRPHPSFV